MNVVLHLAHGDMWCFPRDGLVWSRCWREVWLCWVAFVEEAIREVCRQQRGNAEGQ